MIIRTPDYFDKTEIDRIYKEFFANNEYPEFFNANVFPCSFVVTDDECKNIIVAGGVKLVAEAVVVTDKNFPKKTRFDALFQALGSISIIAKEIHHNQIHVFVNNDENYVKILQRFGFKLLDAKLLILDLEEQDG